MKESDLVHPGNATHPTNEAGDLVIGVQGPLHESGQRRFEYPDDLEAHREAVRILAERAFGDYMERESAREELDENGDLTAEAILSRIDQIPSLMQSDNPIDTVRGLTYISAYRSAVAEGMPNRKAINAIVESRIKQGKPSTYMFVDLTNFKAVNDKLGFTTGDEVLGLSALTLEEGVMQEVLVGAGDVLERSLRRHDASSTEKTQRKGPNDNDIVGHIGGDEYGVILTGSLNNDEKRIVSERIVWNTVLSPAYQTLIADLTGPESEVLSIGMRIGATTFGTRNDELTNASDVVAASDPKTDAKTVEIYCRLVSINDEGLMTFQYADPDKKIVYEIGPGKDLEETNIEYVKREWINPRNNVSE